MMSLLISPTFFIIRNVPIDVNMECSSNQHSIPLHSKMITQTEKNLEKRKPLSGMVWPKDVLYHHVLFLQLLNGGVSRKHKHIHLSAAARPLYRASPLPGIFVFNRFQLLFAAAYILSIL